jgi:hypothetical protein
MPEIENLYSVVKDNGLYTKSYDEFVGKYSDEQNMSKLYQVVYDQGLYTKSFDDFKGKYFTQVKKKESVSPSQQKKGATSSATGAMGPDGAPAPSARKRYDVKGKPAQPVAPAAPAAQLTAKDLEMMMPFRGAVQETTVIGDAPAVQENPFAQDVKRAGDILTKKSPEGDAFTAGIITEKPETKKYAKEVLAAVEAPQENSYIEKIVNSTTASGMLANKVYQLETFGNPDDIDFEDMASYNKMLQDNAIEEEEGVVGFIKYLPTVVMQSLGSMIIAAPTGAATAATGAAAGSIIPGLGTAAGLASGFSAGTSMALEYSSSLMGALRDAGVDITDADQLKSAFSDPNKMAEAREYALKRGIPVAAFDAISGGIAGKLFKTAAGATTKQLIKAGAKETGVQAVLGGAGEATAQLIADGKLDGRQIAYEMVAEPVTAIPPAAINYLGEKAKTAAEKKYVKRIETDANLKLKSDIATIVDPEIAASSKKINEYRKLKEEAVSQTAKDEYDKRISQERDKKYSAYEKFFPVFDSLPDDKKQEAYDALDEVGKVKDEYNAAESPEEKKILGQVLAQKLNKLKGYAVQEQTTSEVPVQPGAAVSGEVAQGEPQAEPQVVTEEGQAQKEVIPAGKRLFNEPNPETVEISKAYKEKNGIVEGEGVKIEAVDVDNASKIADAFEALEDSPNDPEVQDAYNAMADETAKQHQDIIDAGYEVEIWDGEGEPYANAQEMIDDVKNNKHMYIFSTEQGFGDEPITDEQRKQNKLLQDSGLKDKNGKTLLYNDLFRFVHDFFGHTERGNGFGPVGEENAWDVHARMYSPKARRAMTTETRGQNSWVNFGPQMRNEDGSLKKKGDPGYLSPKDRAFAPQKMALMPEEFTQIKEVVSGFDQAVNNSAQSLKLVAPDLKIIVAENTEDAQLQIAEALSAVAPTQAADVAEGFTTETRGQTVFVNGKPFAIVLDKSQADSKTVGHEAWETMLNDAFGDDQAKFKEFRDEIDRQLRLNGFEDIAKALTDFSNQRGYEDVKYSEYMAELGGMLVANGFKQGSLDAKQKSLLQKIGDVINKFAKLFTGKKQFLDEATPDDILGFMITISNKVAKGEDVSQFFRGEKSAAKPSVEARSQQAAIEILDGPKFDNKLKEDVASYLNSLRDSEIPPNSSREELMERFINNVYEEVGYYLYSKPDARSAGLTWYIEDMVEFANKVKVVLPALSDENQYKLFLTVLAFTSSGTNPNQNLLYAYNLWNNSNDPKNFEFSKNWAEKKLSFIDKKGKPVASGVIVKETAKEYTVELVDSLGRTVVDKKGNKKYEKVSKASMKPGYPKSTGYTNRGEIIVGQLEKLEKLYADLGSIDAVVKWLETPHPIAELRKYNESVPDVNGKGPGKTNKEYDPKKNAEGERNGAFIFGEKIGSFYQNMIGIGETITMDLWWSRTWNRYMGTMINTVSGKKEIQEVPRSDRERNIMREAVKMVAEDLNLQVSELQAAIWYFEQELWTKSGNDSPSYSYVTAIDDLTKKLKVDEETRTKLRAAEADLTEAEKRRQNAAERAAAVVASKGGELPKVKVTTKSQKAFEESIQKEEDNVKLKYSESGKLLAPNGKPSNLPEYLARYTRTSVFKDWFGDWENDPKNSSKAVDQNGEPALVYHGSPFGGITKFDRKESAKATSGLKEFGTYFTTNRKVAEIYASEGKISQEKINEINQQINKLEQARNNTRNSSEYYNLEKEIEALKKNKSPKVYAAFLNLRSIKDFDAESKAFPEAWRNLKVDAGYKTATDRDAMDFLKEGKFGVKKVDGVKASNIIDLATGAPKREAVDFVGDVYLVFDDVNDAIRVVEPQTVTTRSQKSVPAVVDEVLTDDGKGNYLFVHYSRELRDTIKPMSGSNNNFTSREEVAAISSVGGVAMYYTKQGQKEQGVGNVPHTVLVPKDKVYFYGTTERGKVINDPENFYPEARRRFQEYKNRGNEANPTEYAFDSNNAAAWIGKVASENGYDMLVTNWGAPTSYRAQTVKELTTEAEYTGFKQIPEPTYEVGDEVFLYGKYAILTDVKPDVLTYEVENAFGGVDSGKFPLTVMTRDKIIMVQKAKPTVTTKSQKIVVNTIPGYERMMGEVEGILDKTMNSRDGSYNRATASAIGYIQKSKVYINADDSQREQIIRDFVKLRGEKFKVAPSVGKILGQIKDVKKVTVNEKNALKDQIKLEAKAARDAAAFVKQLRMQISGRLKMMAGRGVISAKQASTILARYDRMNILNPDMRDRFVDYMANVFQSAEYADKVKEATRLRKTIRKAAKNPDNQAENSKMAKSFVEIDPSRVENIDDYLNNAEQMLKAVSRKTGDVKMRSLVNMTDMFSYVNKEIQAQREQIKNEILSKYQDLVDAGVLDSKMTINEIQKVVEAIEEKKDESEAKAKEAKEAVKQMMDELSPILLQIARTGEDPFTGDPIDLTPDEKRDLVKLAKMDLDSLSLADALKAVEYANNFISNGIFSGIGAIVSINEGSLEPARLKKEGVMSLRLRKYFSPGAGRKWAEQLGTLTMLNKLLFVSNEKAIMVANASGESGIANGKAKAIKIVEKAVKEYTDKFSSLKDFRTGENIIERGILAFVSRTVIGDKFQVQKEFNRRKRLVEETIQALTDPNNSTDADIKKGELIEKVYDKILKDAKNVNDVRAKVSEVNKKAVDWWVNEWSKHYDRMDEVSRSVYNTLLTRDANFTPDRFQSIDLTTASENDFDSSFFSSFENVSTEKSGSLKENKGIENLPSDKNGVKTRIVNLDFDMNNANALTNALIDVETASSVLKAKGFVTSKDFGKIFSSKDDAKLYKRRLIAYANNVRGKNYVDQNELTNMGKALNAIGSFGTAKALFKLSQPLNQSIPPLFNTLVQTGRLDLGTLFSGGNAFIDRTGYPIINRGFSSLADLQAINKKIAEAEKNLLAKGIMGIAEYNNKMLELWLQKPDVFTARSSWLSFYINSLKKQGIDTRGIDWNTHEVNKKAADYAELMVSSQQNVNDSDMQGMLLTDKSSYAKAVRKALFTLMTFTLNQKTRIWSDMRTLSNKKLTSEADRKEALLSLSGAIVELVSFHSISLSVSYIVLRPLIDAMMEALGYEDDEDKELEKKKLLMNKSASIAQSFLKDFILPPMPIVGSYASGKVNEMMDEYGVSEKIAVEGFGIEDGESKFKLYDKEDYSFIDALGPVGIAAEKGKELFDFSALASTGKFDVETRGGLITKKILEENEDLAKINASIMSAYYLGILPGELAYIARKLDKKIKKGAEKVEEEED